MNDRVENHYASSRDRDYLLDYKSIDIHSLQKVDLLDVPLDNVNRDEAVALLLDYIEKKSASRFVLFVDPIKLMRIRPKRKLSYIRENADLILADGAGLQWAAAKMGNPIKERIPMMSLIIDLIRAASMKNHTIYFLGSKQERLEKITKNLQRIFPEVRIIGRQGGYFNSTREALIKESIRKSEPDIIFIGMGFPRQEKWIIENRQLFHNSVLIGIDGAFDILSGQKKKAPDYFQLRGYAYIWRILSRPYRLDRMWYLMVFYFLTMVRGNRKESPEQD